MKRVLYSISSCEGPSFTPSAILHNYKSLKLLEVRFLPIPTTQQTHTYHTQAPPTSPLYPRPAPFPAPPFPNFNTVSPLLPPPSSALWTALISSSAISMSVTLACASPFAE